MKGMCECRNIPLIPDNGPGPKFTRIKLFVSKSVIAFTQDIKQMVLVIFDEISEFTAFSVREAQFPKIVSIIKYFAGQCPEARRNLVSSD
ncbi:hypothetical protein DM15PD_13260 [Aristophania vespae]|nr:hypothetical protein DM15PD_13260 [Aristophania vespae]